MTSEGRTTAWTLEDQPADRERQRERERERLFDFAFAEPSPGPMRGTGDTPCETTRLS